MELISAAPAINKIREAGYCVCVERESGEGERELIGVARFLLIKLAHRRVL